MYNEGAKSFKSSHRGLFYDIIWMKLVLCVPLGSIYTIGHFPMDLIDFFFFIFNFPITSTAVSLAS